MSGRRRGCLPRLLIASAVAVLVLTVVVGGGITFAWRQAAIDTRGEVDFDRPLAIPPLEDGRLDASGTRVFELTARAGRTDLGGDEPSQTWGFNGAYLGPTLRAHRGERVAVNVTNTLETATSVHWHGMHLPARMDGGPHQAIEPGETWRPTWEVDQPAATLWYHPHPHGETADHVSRGLAGMVILADDEEAALALPRTYGVDDLPVIVQDKDVRGSGNLGSGSGRSIVVNGTKGPYAAVSSQRVRLRVLNASSMRVMDFRLDNDAPFAMVASDGGLLPKPFATNHVRLSPGERAELVVTMRAGETRVLQSVKPDLAGNFLSDHFDGGAASFDVLQLRAASTLNPSPAVPTTLSTTNLDTAGSPDKVDVHRSFTLNGREINARSMDMGRIDFAPAVDTTELWRVVNEGGSAHSFHVHDVQFRVLSIDGATPPPELSGLKDTIYLQPHARYRLLMRFADHADPHSPYMVHCHLLQHEDQGMMAQFVVVAAGQQPGRLAGRPAAPRPTPTSHGH